MLLAITSEAISLRSHGKLGAGKATIVPFGVVIMGFITSALVYCVYICCKDKGKNGKKALLTAQTFGAFLYLYGDNISSIINQYGEELECGSRCAERIHASAIICLGIALLFYQLVPPCLHKLPQVIEDSDSNSKEWYSASHMMMTIVKIDALYTVVAVMAQTEDSCSLSNLYNIIRLSFLVISFIFGMILLVSYFKIDYNNKITPGFPGWRFSH